MEDIVEDIMQNGISKETKEVKSIEYRVRKYSLFLLKVLEKREHGERGK